MLECLLDILVELFCAWRLSVTLHVCLINEIVMCGRDVVSVVQCCAAFVVVEYRLPGWFVYIIYCVHSVWHLMTNKCTFSF